MHFYRLVLRVASGSSRKHEAWIAGTLAEIKTCLREDLESPQGAYHALCFEEQIVLECWQDQARVTVVDLAPYVSIEFAGAGTWPLVEDEAQEEVEEAELRADEGLWERVLDGEIEITAHVDWARMALPTLAGQPLAPGEPATLHEAGQAPHTSAYGHHALEA